MSDWWIEDNDDHICICEGEVNDCGEREEIALLYCNRPSLKATQPANARLIAAAPEMLAALRAAKDQLIDLYEELYADDEEDNDVTEAVDMVIAAINKAEGRE
jgi:hypothetical protein